MEKSAEMYKFVSDYLYNIAEVDNDNTVLELFETRFLDYVKNEKFDRVIVNIPLMEYKSPNNIMRAYSMLDTNGIFVATVDLSWFMRNDSISEKFVDFLKSRGAMIQELTDKTCVIKIDNRHGRNL